jgi:hypothetical protein
VLYQLSYSHRFLSDYSNWGESCQKCGEGVWQRNLVAAHAYVLESHGAQAGGVENILGIDD